uniref:hypothetical protein n=1 Tax=Amycolatopsis sp. CA-096443 TaxID=3239919 RepID=UPI003F4931EA
MLTPTGTAGRPAQPVRGTDQFPGGDAADGGHDTGESEGDAAEQRRAGDARDDRQRGEHDRRPRQHPARGQVGIRRAVQLEREPAEQAGHGELLERFVGLGHRGVPLVAVAQRGYRPDQARVVTATEGDRTDTLARAVAAPAAASGDRDAGCGRTDTGEGSLRFASYNLLNYGTDAERAELNAPS